MLLKRRPPGISSQSPDLLDAFKHVEPNAASVLRWLKANKIDFVLVGPVARAIRGEIDAGGPVAIVPAPYNRNWERLCAALTAGRAGLRTEPAVRGPGAGPVAAPIKLTADKLARGRRWLLRCGRYDIDIEGRLEPDSGSEAEKPSREPGLGYQELLYEASRVEVAQDLTVEVAAPEDLEHYSQACRAGSAPEFRVRRTAPAARAAEHKPA